jgi:hypothetical protein
MVLNQIGLKEKPKLFHFYSKKTNPQQLLLPGII